MSVIIEALSNQLKINQEHNNKILEKMDQHLINEAQMFKAKYFEHFTDLKIEIRRGSIEFYLITDSWSFLKYSFEEANDWRQELNTLSLSSFTIDFNNNDKASGNFTKANTLVLCLELQNKGILKSLLLSLSQDMASIKKEMLPTYELEREINKIKNDDLNSKINAKLEIGTKFSIETGSRVYLYVSSKWSPSIGQLEIISKTEKTAIVKFTCNGDSYTYTERVKIDNLKDFIKDTLNLSSNVKA